MSITVAEIQRTISGKIVELAVRSLVHEEMVKSTAVLTNIESLDYFRSEPELKET
ncbi:MAG: hypothetical protein HOC70_02085 [Gammaproteobacteria bacterium]|nr:hypothetical protein [Gammaproteobacteria bacterium]